MMSKSESGSTESVELVFNIESFTSSTSVDATGTNIISPPKINKWITIFLLLNSMIGSGILNQPEVFRKSGILGATVLFAVAGLFIWLGLISLVQCGIEYRKLDYSSLAKSAFGDVGEYIIDIVIVLNTFGALMSYITVVGGTCSELFISWGCSENNPACSVYFVTSIIISFFVLPFCFNRFYGEMGNVSVISILSIGSILLLVIIGGPIHQKSGDIIAINGNGIERSLHYVYMYVYIHYTSTNRNTMRMNSI